MVRFSQDHEIKLGKIVPQKVWLSGTIQNRIGPIKSVGFSNGIFGSWAILYKKYLYSTPPNTGLSGIRMVIFWTQFVSGFQMHSKSRSDIFSH
jgi:hypothetical protein